MKKSIVIVLAVVLAVLVCVAVLLTVADNNRKNPPATEPSGDTQSTAQDQTETIPQTDPVPETTQKPVEVTLPDEGEGSPFDDMPVGDGPSIGLDLGDEDEPTPTTKPTQKPEEPTASQGTTPTQPQETKPQVGSGDGEWDATIDFSELLKP